MGKQQRVLDWLNQRGKILYSAYSSASQFSKPAVREPLGIGFGAIAGALSRYYLTLGFATWQEGTFPFGTFFINLSGAFIMGFFTTLAVERAVISPDLRLTIAVGFLGAYTTFSSYELEAEKLLMKGVWNINLLYWIGSPILGWLCLEVGIYLARRLP